MYFKRVEKKRRLTGGTQKRKASVKRKNSDQLRDKGKSNVDRDVSYEKDPQRGRTYKGRGKRIRRIGGKDVTLWEKRRKKTRFNEAPHGRRFSKKTKKKKKKKKAKGGARTGGV